MEYIRNVNPMNPELKAKWLEALRSGEYKQATGVLRSEEGFCCLGVLCDISGLGEWQKDGYEDCYNYVDSSGVYSSKTTLPATVYREADLADFNPDVAIKNGNHISLADLNDRYYYTFEQIANVIEEVL